MGIQNITGLEQNTVIKQPTKETMMTTAIITVMYFVDIDSPSFPADMTPNQRLTAWLEMARTAPAEALKNLEPSDVDGILEDCDSPESQLDMQLRWH